MALELGYCLACGNTHEKGWDCRRVENRPRDPLLVEREKTHGSFSNVAQLAQNIKMTMRNSNRRVNTAQEEALDLIATKIARIICGNPNEKDHWKDISGYALLGMEACD